MQSDTQWQVLIPGLYLFGICMLSGYFAYTVTKDTNKPWKHKFNLWLFGIFAVASGFSVFAFWFTSQVVAEHQRLWRDAGYYSLFAIWPLHMFYAYYKDRIRQTIFKRSSANISRHAVGLMDTKKE